MALTLPPEILNALQRVGGRFAHRPARDVALWLACIPLVLPAPLIAGIVALSEWSKGDQDPRWRVVMALSAVNFVISAVVLASIAMLFGDWIIGRLNDLFGPIFLLPSTREPTPIPV